MGAETVHEHGEEKKGAVTDSVAVRLFAWFFRVFLLQSQIVFQKSTSRARAIRHESRLQAVRWVERGCALHQGRMPLSVIAEHYFFASHTDGCC